MAEAPNYQVTFTNQQPDEQEVAACMAALLVYLSSEEQANNGGSTEPRQQLSNWGQASLLEGAHVVPCITAPDQISRTGLRRSLIAVLLVLFGNLCSITSAWAVGELDVEETVSVADEQPDPFGGSSSQGGTLPPPSGIAAASKAVAQKSFKPSGSSIAQVYRSFPTQSFSPSGALPAPQFPQTSLPQASSRQGVTIRVGLAIDVNSVEIACVDGAEVIDAATGKALAAVKPHSRWQLALTRGGNGYAMTVCAKRPMDRTLIATGEALSQIKNAAFSATSALMPPVVPSPASASTVAPPKTANPPVLTVPLTLFNDKFVKKTPTAAPAISLQPRNRAIVGAGNGSVTLSGDEVGGGTGYGGATVEDCQDSAGAGTTAGAAAQEGSQAVPSNSTTCGVMIIPYNDFRGGTSNLLSVNGKLYRGAVLVRPSMVGGSARLSAINVLDLEDYLMSVLPSEMPSTWPLEAQKAQAIAARSYAMANLGKNGSRGFDVVPTIADQVYTGISRETDNSSRAVRETAGIIMKHGGRPVSAFFHSTSAGMTEVAEHVWVKGVPYLRSVPDFDVKSKYNNWQRKFDLASLEKVYGPHVGPVLGLFVVSRSPSQRVKSLMVVGQNGTTVTSGKEMRQAFKLPSTNFNVVPENGAYVFKGQGFGHGLGMSQYGARALAEHAYNAAQILKHYYKDVTFDYVVETKTL